MIGLDCNILVQLVFADHPTNKRTVQLVETQTAAGKLLVFPPLVITEFLHVVTDPKRFAPPLSMEQAIGWLEMFMKNPAVEILIPSREALLKTFLWMREFKLGRKRILDTHLAAALVTARVPRLLTSNPADFLIFTELETVTP